MRVKTYGIGLVGTGFMGAMHARAYHLAHKLRPDAVPPPVLVAVADVDVSRTEAFAAQWGAGRASPDWRSVVDDPAVDVVDICTPPSLHYEIAAAAIERGKHVYCEKPVGVSAEQARQLADAAAEAGVATLVGFNYRWIPAVVLLEELVESGRLGEIRAASIVFDSDWALDPLLWDWRFSAAEAGAGALGDVGSHVFDLARFLVGNLVEVCGDSRTFITERGSSARRRTVDTDDAWAAIGRFANGALGTFRGSRVAPGAAVTLTAEIAGSTGAARWSLARMNEVELYEVRDDKFDGFTTVRVGPEHPLHGTFSPVRGLGVGFADSKVAEVQHLLWSLAEDRSPEPSFADAFEAARVVEAVQQEDGWVSLPTVESGRRG